MRSSSHLRLLAEIAVKVAQQLVSIEGTSAFAYNATDEDWSRAVTTTVNSYAIFHEKTTSIIETRDVPGNGSVELVTQAAQLLLNCGDAFRIILEINGQFTAAINAVQSTSDTTLSESAA